MATVADDQAWVKPADLRLKLFSTITICVGALLVWLTIPSSGTELETYRYCAYALLVVLGVSLGIEGLGGVRSLARVDIIALWTLYFLTFAEFLHPHVRLLYEAATGNAVMACNLVLIGFTGIAVGRHIAVPVRATPEQVRLPELSSRALLRLFFVLAFVGYFYVLLTTSFNPFEIIHWLLQQRFDRPWQRGQQGGWLSFLTELNLLLYIVAALGGFVFANARAYGLSARIAVGSLLLFMAFFDFCEGARNVLLIKAGLFLVTFFMASRRTHTFRLLLTTVACAALLWMVSGYMLDFRNQGLGSYLSNGAGQQQSDGFMIDNNMVSIARVVGVFPDPYPFPGGDVVIQIFTKWVPRALWPDKPIGWSTSVEDALATGGGYTLAITYVGEAYLIAGYPTLILVSLMIGAVTSWWNRVGFAARTNLDLVYYASGFFAAALAMRSIQFVTIAIVPVVAFYVLGRLLARSRRKRPTFAQLRVPGIGGGGAPR
ncbi:hypothetical protein QH494_20850 [Sphingomonas sp. AR_OL41]|uniref:hypothetical protein n=1 Tax=Sphingomonas sp. AR_OL41 TaxID=3042729 RepID=UPI00248057B6|nr:hypothetical protein [Sphingomonas sp. AR_OL41]MDH7974647.1 hypothetical protein [Sphingomonas sp. AR_OL41]